METDPRAPKFAIVRAAWLGFWEHLWEVSDSGRTWGDDRDDAYDRGWNVADRARAMLGLTP